MPEPHTSDVSQLERELDPDVEESQVAPHPLEGPAPRGAGGRQIPDHVEGSRFDPASRPKPDRGIAGQLPRGGPQRLRLAVGDASPGAPNLFGAEPGSAQQAAAIYTALLQRREEHLQRTARGDGYVLGSHAAHPSSVSARPLAGQDSSQDAQDRTPQGIRWKLAERPGRPRCPPNRDRDPRHGCAARCGSSPSPSVPTSSRSGTSRRGSSGTSRATRGSRTERFTWACF